MTIEEKARAYDEAIGKAQNILHTSEFIKITDLFPNLVESEDERIRKWLYDFIHNCPNETFEFYGGVGKQAVLAYLEKQKEQKPIELGLKIPDWAYEKWDDEYMINTAIDKYSLHAVVAKHHGDTYDYNFSKSMENWLRNVVKPLILEKQKEQKTIAMEVYEVGKGTTICGQDYRCKKDYKEGNCWYIKNVIYHCSRDGYLNDQNGISWSCTPEWFNEYIYTNSEWADEEKNDFVSGQFSQFLRCKLSFDGFKEGEHYWLEYVGDDMYVGRSDNVLNQRFHITPRQLYTLFSQKLDKAQEPPKKEEQVSSEYETPMFEETPSDKQIIDALIHHLNEQDGFLTAINCVSTKAILSWLKKQKEQKPISQEDFDTAKHEALWGEQKPEWSEEDEKSFNNALSGLKYAYEDLINHKSFDSAEDVKNAFDWLKSLPERFVLQLKPEVECDNETEIQKTYREGKNAGRKEVFDHPEEYGLEYIDNVFGFKIGDKVRLSDGDGRTHVIKRFEKIKGLHGPDFYHVVFEDNTASDHIIPGSEYPNGYFTCIRKIDEEKPETKKGE